MDLSSGAGVRAWRYPSQYNLQFSRLKVGQFGLCLSCQRQNIQFIAVLPCVFCFLFNSQLVPLSINSEPRERFAGLVILATDVDHSTVTAAVPNDGHDRVVDVLLSSFFGWLEAGARNERGMVSARSPEWAPSERKRQLHPLLFDEVVVSVLSSAVNAFPHG